MGCPSRSFVNSSAGNQLGPCGGEDDVDYDLTMFVQWHLNDDGDIRVTGFIGESKWGSPHDLLDDTIVVPNPGARLA